MTKNDQIELLFTKANCDIVEDYLDGDWDKLDSFFTITLQDFYEHVDSLNLPFGYIFNEEGKQDGLYILKKGGGWEFVMQERGQILFSIIFENYIDAKRAAFERDYRRGIILKGL